MDVRFNDLADSLPQAFYGFVILLSLMILGLINVRLGPLNIMFLWLPLFGLFLWPRHAAPLLSLVLVFIAGLIQDILNAQPLGFSALIFVFTFTIFRNRLPRKDMKTLNVWKNYGQLTLGVSLGLVILNGLIQNTVVMYSTVLHVLITIVIFPVYMAIWQFMRRLIIAVDDL